MEQVSRSQSYRKSVEGAETDVCKPGDQLRETLCFHRGFLQQILRHILLEDQTLISLTCKSIHKSEVKQ